MNSHAVLEWREGLPYSTRFNDTYFSVSPENPQHGLAETRHVFLQHNQLAQRWQALPANSPSHFTILETGFGSGLNFLAALQLWQATAPSSARLHFVSVEIAPFSLADLQRAHAHFPELAELSLALCAQYRLLQPGINQLELHQYGVSLTLIIGDAATVLPQLDCTVDAWFLDGFAPSKNPEMWQGFLFSTMARCSQAGSRFATFTCAGVVKRGLQSAGFQVEKVAGYGAKREMLCGYWPSVSIPSPARNLPKVAVIGAGIAGCSTARQLAQLGCEVHLYERAEQIASGASGNPRGMLYPRLNAEKQLNDQLALRSYSFSLRHYASLGLSDRDFQTCGVLQLGGCARELKRVHKVHAHYPDLDLMQLLTPAEASAVAGVEISHDSLFFKAGAWVNPQAACHASLRETDIQQHLQHHVLSLQKTTDGWRLGFSNQTVSDAFEAVAVCTAADAIHLLPDSGMVLNPVRGQMGMVTTQAYMQPLKTVLCGEGYVTPVQDGLHTLGATFAPRETSCDIREADNLSNLNMLSRLSPQFAEATKAEMPFARAALRCGSPDYLPYVGSVLDRAELAAMPPADKYQQLPASRGVYVHVAHGSKGLLTAPYCAALLARRVLQDLGQSVPQLTEDTFWHGLHPQRHLFKQLGWKQLLDPFSNKVSV